MGEVNRHEFRAKGTSHVEDSLCAAMAEVFVPRVKIWGARRIMSDE